MAYELSEETIREIFFEFSNGMPVSAVMKMFNLKQTKAYEMRKEFNAMQVLNAPNVPVKDVKEKGNKIRETTLAFSDPHGPFQHPDTYDFLTAIRDKYKPTDVLNGGDEVDLHYLNYHEKEQRILNPTGERNKAIEHCRVMQDIFPKMILLDSNHGDLVDRKAKTAGIHPEDLKSKKDRLEITADWEWHKSIILDFPNGDSAYCVHHYSGNVMTGSEKVGMSLIQGHVHTQFSCGYRSTPEGLHFGLQLPCLIDTHSPAFKYAHPRQGRIMVGATIIEGGYPKLIPLRKDRHGRWDGKIN